VNRWGLVHGGKKGVKYAGTFSRRRGGQGGKLRVSVLQFPGKVLGNLEKEALGRANQIQRYIKASPP